MMDKYRVHEVAKDLNVPSKEIINFLGEHFEEPKKHMTALEENELNLVFEHYTKQTQVENFEEYFNMGEDKNQSPKVSDKQGNDNIETKPQPKKVAATTETKVATAKNDENKQPKVEQKAEVKPTPKTEVKAETKPAPKTEAKPAPKPEAKPIAKPEAKVEAKVEAKPQVNQEVKAQPIQPKNDVKPVEKAPFNNAPHQEIRKNPTPQEGSSTGATTQGGYNNNRPQGGYNNN
ncbi:MAG: translation initiation factor IF-2 N-terminal domain-containing protein, partial [Oscillospiraceae bacterium]